MREGGQTSRQHCPHRAGEATEGPRNKGVCLWGPWFAVAPGCMESQERPTDVRLLRLGDGEGG